MTKNTTEKPKERKMKTTKTIILTALITLLIAAPALADNGIYVLYVDDGGSDSTGDGTYDAPYATIQKAVDQVPDIITKHYKISVDAGTYREQVDIYNKRCLGANASLTIEGDTTTPSNVRVTGADSGADSTPVRNYGINVVGSDNVIIKGVLANYGVIAGIHYKMSTMGVVSYCEASDNTGIGIAASQLAHVDISNCTCNDNRYGIQASYNAFAIVNNCTANSNDAVGIKSILGAYIYAADNVCNANAFGINAALNGTMETNNNSTTGTTNSSWGQYANNGGVIDTSGTTPTGSSGNSGRDSTTFGLTF